MGGLFWLGIGFLLGDKEQRDKLMSMLKQATRKVDEKINETIGYSKSSEPDSKLRTTKQRQDVEEVD